MSVSSASWRVRNARPDVTPGGGWPIEMRKMPVTNSKSCITFWRSS